MKLTILENCEVNEPEIEVRCRKADESILRVLAAIRAIDNKLTGTLDEHTFILNAADILYIDTTDRKTFLYTVDKVFESPLKLYDLEERLAGDDFIRITKSSIVNFSKVKSLRGDFGGRLICKLENGENLNVSRQYAVTIKQKLGIIKGGSL